MSIGDFVVHEKHGLGIYRGIEKVEVDKVAKDYIKIEYRDGSNLYILATQLDATAEIFRCGDCEDAETESASAVRNGTRPRSKVRRCSTETLHKSW